LIKDGDIIEIDAEKRTMNAVGVDDAEWAKRRASWKAPPLEATSGTLYKYTKLVASASQGCVTDL
jgi:dihydroxy-acid dehydratase